MAGRYPPRSLFIPPSSNYVFPTSRQRYNSAFLPPLGGPRTRDGVLRLRSRLRRPSHLGFWRPHLPLRHHKVLVLLLVRRSQPGRHDHGLLPHQRLAHRLRGPILDHRSLVRRVPHSCPWGAACSINNSLPPQTADDYLLVGDRRPSTRRRHLAHPPTRGPPSFSTLGKASTPRLPPQARHVAFASTAASPKRR